MVEQSLIVRDHDEGSAASIAAALKRPRYRLQLGSTIDALYEAATVAGRIGEQKRMLVVFFLFYAAAIGLDAGLGVLKIGLVIRFGVVAPLVVLCILLLSARWSDRVQGILGTLPIVAMPATIQLIGLHLPDMLAQRYMFAAGLLTLHVNISYAQRWHWTIVTALCNTAATWSVLVIMRGWGGAAALADLAIFNSTIMIATLYWSFRAEQGRRNTFLYGRLTEIHTTTLNKANLELRRMSRTDSLTGLANRRAFDEDFESAWHGAQRAGDPLALLLIDVDHFKAFNDTAGHAAGDVCLRLVAEAIRDALRGTTAMAARYGGEEFAVILPGCDAGGARDLANRVRSAVLDRGLMNPGRTDGPQCVSVSVGSTSNRGGALAMCAMVEAADAALYRAKVLGRNRVSSSDDDPQVRAAA